MEGNEEKGMWILYAPDRYSVTTVNFRCSQCRVITKLPGYPVPECPYKYCPHCGGRNYNPHAVPEDET